METLVVTSIGGFYNCIMHYSEISSKRMPLFYLLHPCLKLKISANRMFRTAELQDSTLWEKRMTKKQSKAFGILRRLEHIFRTQNPHPFDFI